ncbi:MAG: helix-turn-helix transcriptional regulator [Planctomycetes bacterium]|nr:helix-turn-helix transcriptional regulator [Planctomycetota bacterium]
MDKSVNEMKRLAGKVRKQGKAYEETSEGQELVLRMEFAANVLKALRARKMTNAEFCRKIGMKSPQFSRIIQGDENITITTMSRIVRALGYCPEIKFRRIRKQEAESQ